MVEGTIPIYLGGEHDEAYQVLDRFREVAARLGYVTERGPRASIGQGHAGKLLEAIATGEVVVRRREENHV